MTGKEYLWNIRKQRNARMVTQEEIMEVKKKILYEIHCGVGMGTSGGKGSDISDRVERWESYLEKIKREENLYIRARDAAKGKINKVEDGDERALLTARYLINKKWEDIASDMDYSVPGIYKLHGRALIHFEKANPEIKRMKKSR